MRYSAGEYGRSPIGVWWVLIGVPGGIVYGAAGGAWRDGDGVVRWLPVALLLGALAGEGTYFLLRGGGGPRARGRRGGPCRVARARVVQNPCPYADQRLRSKSL
jgi:Family of unknown function (DUF6518)